MRIPLRTLSPRVRSRRVPSPALVLSMVAVVGACVAPAWAAGLITGDDIANGTITGKDIKDGSIGPSDISRTGRAALAGATGVAGKVGPAGPAGGTGPAGPSGATGATGARGEAGATGVAGATGAVGATGAKGADGATGAQGATGADGTGAASLWAVVDGSDANHPKIISTSAALPATVAASAPGSEAFSYALTFPHDVTACAATVTRRLNPADTNGQNAMTGDAGDAEAGGSAYTYSVPGGDLTHVLYVRLVGANGTHAGSFSVALSCPDAAPVALAH